MGRWKRHVLKERTSCQEEVKAKVVWVGVATLTMEKQRQSRAKKVECFAPSNYST